MVKLKILVGNESGSVAGCLCRGLPIALQHAARYIVGMNSRSLASNAFLPARLTAILSLGLLLRAART